MSEDALVESLRLQLRVLREQGATDVLVVPGNYGLRFAHDQLHMAVDQAVQCSNYFGDIIDAASMLGFRHMLIVGHIGKMAKVAGGIMNTHSRVADCRMEVLAAHMGLVAAPQSFIAQVMDAPTTEAALDILACSEELFRCTMESLVQALEKKLAARAANGLRVNAIVFSNVYDVLGCTSGVELPRDGAPRWGSMLESTGLEPGA